MSSKHTSFVATEGFFNTLKVFIKKKITQEIIAENFHFCESNFKSRMNKI